MYRCKNWSCVSFYLTDPQTDSVLLFKTQSKESMNERDRMRFLPDLDLIWRYASKTHTHVFYEYKLHRVLLDEALSKSSEMFLDRPDGIRSYSQSSGSDEFLRIDLAFLWSKSQIPDALLLLLLSHTREAIVAAPVTSVHPCLHKRHRWLHNRHANANVGGVKSSTVKMCSKITTKQ